MILNFRKFFFIQITLLFVFLEISSAFGIIFQKSFRNSEYFSREISVPKRIINRKKWFINFYKSLENSDKWVKKSALINGWDQLPLGYIYI